MIGTLLVDKMVFWDNFQDPIGKYNIHPKLNL